MVVQNSDKGDNVSALWQNAIEKVAANRLRPISQMAHIERCARPVSHSRQVEHTHLHMGRVICGR
jgi:hypothetical protein